jgi:hypothetical protein
MLYRAFLVLLVGFWATMWTLLIRSEVQPNSAGVRALPVEHVLREIFRSERDSTLHITDGTARYGILRLFPKAVTEDGLRKLDFGGNFSMALAGTSRQRIAWDGELVLTSANEVESFRLNTTSRDVSPPSAKAGPGQIDTHTGREPTRLDVHLRPRAKSASYEMRVGDSVMDQQDFALDEAGLKGLLSHLGMEGDWQRQFNLSENAKPKVTASQSTMNFRGTKLETYALVLTMNEQTLLTIHVSQLGEIMRVESVIGWKLEQE